MNYEPNELIENADIVRFIKSGRIAWLGHVMRMDDKRTPKRILQWKPIGTRIRGRPRKRWIAAIEEDMQIMGIRRRRRGTARTLPNFCVVPCIFVLFYVLFVLCRSLYCLCVYVYCTTATRWLPNCS
jgi:hypothetical protein